MSSRKSMHTPPKPARRARSWLAAALALTMLGLGQSILASSALADETPEPTPSAEISAPADPEPSATASASASATPSASAKPVPTASAEPTAKRVAAALTDLDATAAKEGTRYEVASDPGAVYWVPTTWVVGEPLVISGTGWRNKAGDAGSIIAVKLDDGGVSTTVEVKHPVTGVVQLNKTIYAVVQADANGEWTLRVPYPTTANSNASWAVGQNHNVRLLTGSMLDEDVIRSGAGDITVAADSTPDDPARQPPSWAHSTVTAGGAIAWVQSEVATASGSTIRIKGIHWTDQAGTGASTIALKLNHAGGQYARTGAGVVAPGGKDDPTIWKLLAPAGTASHPNLIEPGADGDFEIEMDAPAGLRAGQLLTVQFLTGKFGVNDTVRNVTSAPLVVGGVPYVEQPDEEVTCTPTSVSPVVTIAEPRVAVGGTLHVTGSGFCHPDQKRGGSTIAIKIDDGNYSRVNDAIHSNRTIWTIIEAKASDGTFDIDLQLPDGTTSAPNGSTPAFPQGAHTLRFLTGSLKDGDVTRTVPSSEFVVGDYRPTGMPDPVEATEDLTSSSRNGVTVTKTAKRLTVTVPGAGAGDWVYLNTYADGSPTSPWGTTWFRTDADGRAVASLTGVTLPTGTSKLSVQSGNDGEYGKLLGWTSLTVAGPKTATPTPVTAVQNVTTTTTTTTTTETDDSSSAPTTIPEAPVARASQLTALSNGDATATADGTKITVTVPKSAAKRWVYVYLYSGASIARAGWVQLNSAKAFTVDLKDLADGRHRIVAVNADGAVLGWVEASKGTVATTPLPAPIDGVPNPPTDTGAGAGAVNPQAAPAQTAGGSLEAVLIGAAIAVLTAGGLAVRRLATKPRRVAR
ncbi:MAG: hypothetical protein QM619_10180 [Micropruina sp.]|uniref:hypothetical protein n=1 Tax=Micropruina sp. TaxID=2737536 RepID=UPI0039E59F43